MMTRMRMGLLAPLLVCLMTACGGGGGGSATPPPNGNNPPPTTPPPATTPGPTGEDVTNARSSELKANLRLDTRELTITWKDAFTTETGFTVEVRAADGTWQVLESLPAGQATGTPYQWQRVIDASSAYRVRATREGYSVPLEIWSDVPQIVVNLTNEMSIELDPAPPVSGPVRLFIANPVDVQAVTYYVDTQTISTSNTGPDFSVNWSSLAFTEGEHLLQATVRLGSGVSVDLRRTIMVDNPAVAVSMSVFTRGPAYGDTLWFQGNASAAAGIEQLEFFANGAPLRVLEGAGLTSFDYNFYILTQDLPGGTNEFRVVATDADGMTAEATRTFDIDNRPRLTVTSPANGLLARNTLRLEGTFSEDVSTAQVLAFLGDVQILQTAPAASGAFELDYSLAGLPAGEYTLSVRAVDAAGRSQYVTRRVIVPPSQLTFELVASDVAELLATEQGAVLFRKTDGSVVLRSAAGVETTLPIPTGATTTDYWQLDGGHVVMRAQTAPGTAHIFAISPSGQLNNLSLQGGSASNGPPKLKSPWVMWGTESSANHFQLYNLETDAVTVVSRPPEATAPLSIGSAFDMVTTPGAEQFLFTAQTGAFWQLTDVFRYDLQSQVTDVLTGGDAGYFHVTTDNIRLLWSKTPLGDLPRELIAAPVSNASATTSLGGAGDFRLRDGLAVWNTDTFDAIKADDGTAPTVDIGGSGAIYSVASGRVLFSEFTRFLTWSAAGGEQTLLHNLPIDAVHNGNSAFITTGTSDLKLLYRISLP